MRYRIEEREPFSLIGQEIVLTTSQKENMKISMQFWQRFNHNLKEANLSQHGHWLKYAIMERRNNNLYYFCAIPDKGICPSTFISKHIDASTYVVVEHVGSMNDIYVTYDHIYHKIIPQIPYVLYNRNFLHFEKYDERFHWNRQDSIIEIWVPIQSKKE